MNLSNISIGRNVKNDDADVHEGNGIREKLCDKEKYNIRNSGYEEDYEGRSVSIQGDRGLKVMSDKKQLCIMNPPGTSAPNTDRLRSRINSCIEQTDETSEQFQDILVERLEANRALHSGQRPRDSESDRSQTPFKHRATTQTT
ncbi:hypothetical protein FQA39_LY01583 [Lamprigera yunnana]|nr:hypothetical protein FQA39_LY01583 [Lamprigera yunnana]